jgi:hypothetical protein
MSDAIKASLRQIEHYLEILQRETGKVIDPPDFTKCFDAVDDITGEAHTIWQELDDWERSEMRNENDS